MFDLQFFKSIVTYVNILIPMTIFTTNFLYNKLHIIPYFQINGIKHFENWKSEFINFLHIHIHMFMFRLLEGNMFLRSKIYTYVKQYK